MSLKEVINDKINKIRSGNGFYECETCKKVTSKKELEYNAQFTAYDNKCICDKCADKIDA